MRMYSVHAMALAAALMSAPAFAQTATPPAAPAPAPAEVPKVAPPPVLMTNTEQKQGQWLASKMVGVDVYNASNEKVGDITELLITQDGKVDAIVVGVGGFLGIGQHDVAVPMSEVKWVERPMTTSSTSAPPATMPPATSTAPAPSMAPAAGATDRTATTGTVAPAPGAAADTGPRAYPDHAVISMTREQLKAAPAFKYAK